MAGNFVVNMFLTVSLSLLWNLINVLQMLLTLPLVDVSYPQNALTFNKQFLMIANFEIIPIEKFLTNLIKFGPLMPFSQTFNEFGIDNYNIILNLGFSLIILIVSIFVLPLLFLIFWFLDIKCGQRNS